tara:strand:+ start:5084 stop:6100 length:1017 start_codon:yes stop_codon:yes gene_type:complete
MRILATSENAINALIMLTKAQDHFVKQLSQLCTENNLPSQFSAKEWLRDEGSHGGGVRFEAPENSIFNQASVNVSQIQYEENKNKAFISASALSTIIHPVNPLSPSVHIHVSWTHLRTGKSYWRLMADLNPAIACDEDTAAFNGALEQLGGQYFEVAKQAGDNYFYIPALEIHRGVSHFYLEGFNPENESGIEYAQQFLLGIIDTYIAIFKQHLKQPLTSDRTLKAEQKQLQLDYHTRYFYQVLTLDKGTTAGLLIHDQNDLGTLGSLPRFINRELLFNWVAKTPAPRNKLVEAIVSTLPQDNIHNSETPENQSCEITEAIKKQITKVMREHYKNYPL